MSGVFGSIRRTLLSCTSLARNGTIALGSSMVAMLASTTSSHAGDISLLDGIRGFNHQEFAVLTTALALLGFTVIRGEGRRALFAVAALAIGVLVSALSAALTWGPAYAWAWVSRPVELGLLTGAFVALVALFVVLYVVLRLLGWLLAIPDRMRTWSGRRAQARDQELVEQGWISLLEGRYAQSEKDFAKLHEQNQSDPFLKGVGEYLRNEGGDETV